MKSQRGFTLMEMIIVMVITGIIWGMVAMFIKSPIDGYVATVRRAELSDMTDTAFRRIARDVRLALPNSVRNPANGDSSCVEFIPTKAGGRYRAVPDTSGVGDDLDFSLIDSSFQKFAPADSEIAAGDIITIYNDGSGSSDCSGSIAAGTSGGNAYCGYNAIEVSGVTAGIVSFTTSISTIFQKKQLPLTSPSYHFQVIPSNEHVVGYVCSGVGTDASGNGTGTLYRYSRKLISGRNIPSTCSDVSSGATQATLTEHLSACSLTYDQPGSSTGLSNSGIMAISLEVKEAGEAASIYQQTQVDNIP